VFLALVVFLPALMSLAGIIYRFFLASSPSVLHFQSNGKSLLHWLQSNFLKLPTGLLLCAAGLALMMVFLLRVSVGVSAFRGFLQSGNLEGCNSEAWERVRTLVFVLVGPATNESHLFLRDLQVCFVVDDHAQYHLASRSSNIRRRTRNPFPLAGCDWIFTASILARHRKTACAIQDAAPAAAS
jgi:hypothetical protein